MQEQPSEEDYRLLIDGSWTDLHHSRIQEWTALGVVTGAHLGLTQVVDLALKAGLPLEPSLLIEIGASVGAAMAIFGGLITCRHRRLMKVKFSWIYRAEDRLGLVKKPENDGGIIPQNKEMEKDIPWNGLSIPRLLSTSGLILLFYITLLLLDVAVFTAPSLVE